jgi:hypothetical protein
MTIRLVLRPFNTIVSQPPSVHFFAKSLRILFHAFADKPIPTRRANRVRLAAERFRRTPIGARPSIVRSSFLRPSPAIDDIELIVGV